MGKETSKRAIGELGAHAVRSIAEKHPRRVGVLHVIKSVAAKKDFTIDIVFDRGRKAVVDFRPIIKQGGVFASLGSPAFFRRVKIAGGGRFLAWPGELEFCADALYLDSHERDDE